MCCRGNAEEWEQVLYRGDVELGAEGGWVLRCCRGSEVQIFKGLEGQVQI